MTSPYWAVMNDLDSTITNFIQIREMINDNVDDPKALLLTADLLDHYIEKQDQAMKKAWNEVVNNTTVKYTDEELDAMCDQAERDQVNLEQTKEQIYKNYRAAIDEYNKLNEKYKSLEESHFSLQDLFYKVDGELDELKVKYEAVQKNYHTVVNNVMNRKPDKIDLALYP